MAFDFTQGKPVSAAPSPGGFDFSKGTPAATPAPKPGFNPITDALGIGAEQQPTGFFSSLFKNTLGSGGVSGLLQFPGRMVESGFRSMFSEQVSQGQTQLADVTSKLLEKAKSLPEGDPHRDQLLQIAHGNFSHLSFLDNQEAAVSADQPKVGLNDFGSKALNTVLTLGPTGAGKLTVGQGARAFGSSLGRKFATDFVTGAGYATADDLSKDKSLQETARDAFRTGITTGILGSGLSLTGLGIKKAIDMAPERLYNSALRISQRMIEAGKSPVRALINRGHFGTLGQIAAQARAGMEAVNARINTKLEADARTVGSRDLIRRAEGQLGKRFAQNYTAEERAAAIRRLPIAKLLNKESLTLKEANQLRSSLDQMLNDRYYLSQNTPSLERAAMGTMAGVLRKAVKGMSKTTKEFEELATYTATNKVVRKAIAASEKNFGFGLKDILITGLFGVAGGVGPAAGALLTEKALTSPLSKTGGAVAFDRIRKMLETKGVDLLRRGARPAVLKGAQQLTQ